MKGYLSKLPQIAFKRPPNLKCVSVKAELSSSSTTNYKCDNSAT